jgi:hypothetical protein
MMRELGLHKQSLLPKEGLPRQTAHLAPLSQRYKGLLLEFVHHPGLLFSAVVVVILFLTIVKFLVVLLFLREHAHCLVGAA